MDRSLEGIVSPLLTLRLALPLRQWLIDNGAAFPKLAWPAPVGDGGVRGVRATAPIAPHEEMLRVPRRLLISEELCWRDPQLGRVFDENRDVFSRDDPVLALFLVREMVCGEQSFFHPYLAILPEPESVQDWTDAELEELRDRYDSGTLCVGLYTTNALADERLGRLQAPSRRRQTPHGRDPQVLRPRVLPTRRALSGTSVPTMLRPFVRCTWQ